MVLGVRGKLVVSEVSSFTVAGLAILYYWAHAGYVTVGIVFTVEFLISIYNTVLWFATTDTAKIEERVALLEALVTQLPAVGRETKLVDHFHSDTEPCQGECE
jgi:hypothetical protein